MVPPTGRPTPERELLLPAVIDLTHHFWPLVFGAFVNAVFAVIYICLSFEKPFALFV